MTSHAPPNTVAPLFGRRVIDEVCYVTAAAVIVSFATSVPSVSAQPAPAPAPLLNDIPANATLPSDGVFDLAGLALGMTFSEITNKYKEFAPDAKPKVSELAAGMRDNRGNSVSFAYDAQSSLSFNNSDGSAEEFTTYFTTKINESRAVRFSRRVSYFQATQQGSVPALIEGLNKKYGPPSYTEQKDRTIEVVYVWFDGKRQTLNEKTSKSRYRYGTPASCITMDQDVGQYRFAPERKDPRPGCNAAFVVKIGQGTRDDLIQTVSFEMIDKIRYMKNGAETDAWLKQQLKEKIAGQSGAQAPRL